MDYEEVAYFLMFNDIHFGIKILFGGLMGWGNKFSGWVHMVQGYIGYNRNIRAFVQILELETWKLKND